MWKYCADLDNHDHAPVKELEFDFYDGAVDSGAT